MARRIVTKLVVSTGMSPGKKIGRRTLSIPRSQGSRSLAQIVPKFVSPDLQAEANERMKILLEESYEEAKAMLQRNQDALDALIDELMRKDTISGDTVRSIVEKYASPVDLEKRAREKQVAEEYLL